MSNTKRDKLADKYEVGEERAQNYVDCYLPSWAMDNWTESDTNFLHVYINEVARDAVKFGYSTRDEEVLGWRACADGLGKLLKVEEAKIKKLVDCLIIAKQKLAIYRAERSDSYTGGMEYKMLIDYIDEALHESGGAGG